MNYVLIPCFSRPEMLHWCCEQIKKADGAKDFHYVFKMDYGYQSDLHTIIDRFPFSCERIKTIRHKWQDTKQSFNVLDGYEFCAKRTDEFVFMIEEDIMISNDFFTWHEAVHNSVHNLFCSIAVNNPNRLVIRLQPELNEFYTTTNDYCSLGVCYRKEVLLQQVMPFCMPAYFSRCVQFVLEHFPDSSLHSSFSEQDGLIRRIQERLGPRMPIAYPYIPRAYHAGFYGKNRRKPIYSPTLDSRINLVGSIIFDDQQMQIHAMNEAFYHDSKPVRLQLPEWNLPLQLEETFS